MTSTSSLQKLSDERFVERRPPLTSALQHGRGANQRAGFLQSSGCRGTVHANRAVFGGAAYGGAISVNTATATALACIPGIGYNSAQSILSYGRAVRAR